MSYRRDKDANWGRDIASGDRRSIGSSDRRDLAADRSDRAFFGDLPSYLTDVVDDVASVGFWFRHKKLLTTNYSDSDGVEPLLDFSGGHAGTSPDASSQPVYRSDHLELSGGQLSTAPSAVKNPDKLTLFGVYTLDGGNEDRMISHQEGTSVTPTFSIRDDISDIGKIKAVARDSDSNLELSDIAYSAPVKLAFACSLDVSGGSINLTSDDGTGEQTDSASQTFSGNFASTELNLFARGGGGATGNMSGKCFEAGAIYTEALSGTERSSLVSSLVSEHSLS